MKIISPEYAAPDGAKNILFFISTNMSRLRAMSGAHGLYSGEKFFHLKRKGFGILV